MTQRSPTSPPLAPRFPHTPAFAVGEHTLTPAELIARIGHMMTSTRREALERVVLERTYTVVPVLEHFHDQGNISAVMRSAEGMGLGAMHLIRNGDELKVSRRTAKGADKWLDVWDWTDTMDCVEDLRAKGYRIVATHLDETAQPIGAIDFTQPTALVFGNERAGVSPELLAASDARCIIPISGFIQSFNVSVAAALAFYHARQHREAHGGHGDLSEAQREILRAELIRRAVTRADDVLLAMLRQDPPS